MEGQINLFEYVNSINDPEFQIKEILNEIKANIVSKGYKGDWVSETIDLNKSGVVFLKNGKLGYKSSCHNYDGYYLLGGFGSVKCKCAGLLPGVIGNKICFLKDLHCPYLEQEGKHE